MASDVLACDASADGIVGVDTAEGDGPGTATLDRPPGENMYTAPPTSSTPTRAAAATRAGMGMTILHGIRRSRSCGVDSMRRSAASTAPDGALVGPTSIHDRAARSS